MWANALILGSFWLYGHVFASIKLPNYLREKDRLEQTMKDTITYNPNSRYWPDEILKLALDLKDLRELLRHVDVEAVWGDRAQEWKDAALEATKVRHALNLADELLQRGGSLNVLEKVFAQLSIDKAKGSKPLSDYIKHLFDLCDKITQLDTQANDTKLTPEEVYQQLEGPSRLSNPGSIGSAGRMSNYRYHIIRAATALIVSGRNGGITFTVDLPYRTTQYIIEKCKGKERLVNGPEVHAYDTSTNEDILVSAYINYAEGKSKDFIEKLAEYVDQSDSERHTKPLSLSLAELFLKLVNGFQGTFGNKELIGTAVRAARRVVYLDGKLYFEWNINLNDVKEVSKAAQENINQYELIDDRQHDEHLAKYLINLYYVCVGNDQEVGHCSTLLCAAAIPDSPLKEIATHHCRVFVDRFGEDEFWTPQCMGINYKLRRHLVVATNLMRFVFKSQADAIQQILQMLSE